MLAQRCCILSLVRGLVWCLFWPSAWRDRLRLTHVFALLFLKETVMWCITSVCVVFVRSISQSRLLWCSHHSWAVKSWSRCRSIANVAHSIGLHCFLPWRKHASVWKGLCRLRDAFEVGDSWGHILSRYIILLATSEVSGWEICLGAVCLRLKHLLS